MCLGWSRSKVFAAVIGELGAVGVLAGLLGTLLAAALVAAFDLDLSLARTMLVVPVAAVLALLAGIAPAWRASGGDPLDSVAPPALAPRRPRPVKTMWSMARANLLRVPGRTAIGTLGLVLGVAALTLLLALNNALQGTLVGTLLGNHISVQVRAVDLVSVVLVILLGAASVADVLFLNLKERAAEFATLSTSGWGDREIRALALMEALGIALLGGVAGAGLGLGISGLVRGVALLPSFGIALAVLAGGVLITLLACLVPVAGLARLTPTTVLAEE